MIRISNWTTGAMTVLLLVVTAPFASVHVLQAEPAEPAQPAAKSRGAGESKIASDETDPNMSLSPMRDRVSTTNMKKLMLTLHEYQSDHNGAFPPAYTVDSNGRPLLSWRVFLLPYLETWGIGDKRLHEVFHYDEPWDSPHNKKLLSYMPTLYWSPRSKVGGFKTNYLGVAGKRMMFHGNDPVKVEDVKDEWSNTIMLVEVNDDLAVEWTRPVDFHPDTKAVRPTADAFGASMLDGRWNSIPRDFKPNLLWSLYFRNDGKPTGAWYP